MKCPDCDGTGWTIASFVRRMSGQCSQNVRGKCSGCDGSGEIDALRQEWRTIGKQMHCKRIAAGRTLRDEAKRHGISPTELSGMEQGRIEPIVIDP
jgi:DnaJ-class molecular chaperone